MGYHFPIACLSRDAIQQTKQAGRIDGWEKKYSAFLNKEPYGKHQEILGENPIEDPLYPAAAYNAVIAPLRGLGFKGMITQLGNDYPYMYYEAAKAAGTLQDRALGHALHECLQRRVRLHAFRGPGGMSEMPLLGVDGGFE